MRDCVRPQRHSLSLCLHLALGEFACNRTRTSTRPIFASKPRLSVHRSVTAFLGLQLPFVAWISPWRRLFFDNSDRFSSTIDLWTAGVNRSLLTKNSRLHSGIHATKGSCKRRIAVTLRWTERRRSGRCWLWCNWKFGRGNPFPRRTSGRCERSAAGSCSRIPQRSARWLRAGGDNSRWC
jgi:hypothetical protein